MLDDKDFLEDFAVRRLVKGLNKAFPLTIDVCAKLWYLCTIMSNYVLK